MVRNERRGGADDFYYYSRKYTSEEEVFFWSRILPFIAAGPLVHVLLTTTVSGRNIFCPLF